MTGINSAKFALAVVAAFLLGIGIRLDNSGIRFAGIALLVIAFLLRFSRKDTTE